MDLPHFFIKPFITGIILYVVSTDAHGKGEWTQCFAVAGVFLPTGYHFGVSAVTGGVSDIHDIISIRHFDKTDPLVSPDLLIHAQFVVSTVEITVKLPEYVAPNIILNYYIASRMMGVMQIFIIAFSLINIHIFIFLILISCLGSFQDKQGIFLLLPFSELA